MASLQSCAKDELETMTEKVVYILGAGFSAPLGLPVMSNFYLKSRDQYSSDRERFADFQDVYDEIDKMHKAKSYYETDLFNIEDILSILDFRIRLGTHQIQEKRQRFLSYVKDVIEFYTPPFAELEKKEKNTLSLTSSDNWMYYVSFVAALLRCSFADTQQQGISGYDIPFLSVNKKVSEVEYSVITLNYDLILEKIEQHLKRFEVQQSFRRNIDVLDSNIIYLAKLHGSIDTGDIVPPTSTKDLNGNALADWQTAYKILSEANYIRIVGYSLPNTDTYIKYLLRATVVESPHLKQIDVLCLDPDGTVRQRYNDFIIFKNHYQFKSASTMDYLKRYHNTVRKENGFINFGGLEKIHEDFFKS